MISIIIDVIANFLVRMANDVFDAIISGFGLDTTLKIMSSTTLANTSLEKTGIHYLAVFFRVLGWVVLFLGAIVIVIQIITGVGNNKRNPASMIIRLIFAGFMIAFSSEVFSLLAYVVDGLFSLISGTWAGNADWNVPFTVSLDITENLIRLAFYIALASAELVAIVSYLERVVLFTIYLYFYPVAIAFAAVEQGSETFIDWLKGVGSQLLTILLSYALMYMGMDCIISGINNSNIGGFINVQISADILNLLKSNDALVMFAMGLVLFGASKSVEKLLSMFNIKTMSFGEAGGALRGAFATASGLAAAGVGMALKEGGNIYSGEKHKFASGLSSFNSAGMSQAGGIAFGAQATPMGMFEGVDKTAKTLFSDIKFDGKGKPLMPDAKTMMQKATEAGVINKEPAKSFMGTINRNISNMKARDTFTSSVESKLMSMNEAKANLNTQLRNGEINPTVKDSDGQIKPMSNRDLFEATNMSEIKPNIKPKEGNVTPAFIDNNENKLAYVFEGVDTKTGAEIEYLFTKNGDIKFENSEEYSAYTYKSDDGLYQNPGYIHTENARETEVITRTLKDQGSFVLGNTSESDRMVNISMRKTERETIPANDADTGVKPKDEAKTYKKSSKKDSA